MSLTNHAAEPHGAQRGRSRKVVASCTAALALVLLALLTGCGGSSDDQALRQNTGEGGRLSAAEVPELAWGINVKDLALNVLSAPTVPNVTLLANVGQGLLTYAPYGDLQPGLASDWKQVSPTVYTYTLKPGQKFSNGKPVTMDDVLYSMRRAKDPKTGPVSSIFYLTTKSIEADGPNTVKVTLRSPDPTWKYTPGHYAGWIYEKASTEAAGDNFGSATGIPIGSGPYKITEFTTDHVTFTRNPYFSGPRPPVAQFVVRLITDDATRLAAMQSGDIDGTVGVPLVNTPQWAKLANVELLSVPSPNTATATFNVTRPPFDDQHVRRAMMYAFDRESVVRSVLHGNADVAETLVQPDMWVNELTPEEAIARRAEQGPQYPFDMEKAREELAQSRHPSGFTTSVDYTPDDASTVLALQVWAQSLKTLGINLKLHEVTGTQAYERAFKGVYSMNMGIGSFDYPDPLNLLPLYCGCHKPPNGFNLSRFDNPEYDKLLDDAVSEPDHDKRVDAIMRSLTIAASAVPAPTLWSINSVNAVNRKYVQTGFGPWTWLRPWMSEIGARAASEQ